jgi:hypothetical protein
MIRWLAAALAACALPLAAAPVPVAIGTERLVLDSPPGFSDALHLSSPRLQELAESLASASDRVLLFALADADLRAFMSGDRPDYRRYMVIVTPARLERERVDSALFATVVGDSLRELGQPAGTDDYFKYLDAQPPGRASLLAELRREPELVSVLQGARHVARASTFWEKEKWRYIVSTHTMLLLRGKVLQLVIYSGFEGPQDLGWIRFTTQRWVDELLRLNRR